MESNNKWVFPELKEVLNFKILEKIKITLHLCKGEGLFIYLIRKE